MIRSFRLRLALSSVLLCGIALAAFGVGAWWQIRSMRIARIDKDVRRHAERESSRTRDALGWQRTESAIISEIGVRDAEDFFLLVRDAGGEVLYRSPQWPDGLDLSDDFWPKERPPRTPPPPYSGPELRAPAPPPSSATIVRVVNGHAWRIGLATTRSSRVAVGVDTASISSDMEGIRNAFVVAMPLALLIIGVGAWVFSSRALRPLQKLTIAMKRVSIKGLDQRLSSRGEDKEFVELIEFFNHMLERLERNFQQAQRFSADAAHELKTPLAILQGQLERSIHEASDGSPLQSELTSILDEVRRLSSISGKLLLLSRADAGRLVLYPELFDLSKALVDLVEDTKMLAPHLKVKGDIQPHIIIEVDGALVLQVLHNLISNAIKYNIADGHIRISALRETDQIEVVVENTCLGIPASEREKIFDRFYRADSARSRQSDGFGLGLSVSREIARAHGGDVIMRKANQSPVEFVLVLPLTARISDTC